MTRKMLLTDSARVRAYLAEHPDATDSEVARALGLDRRLVHAARKRDGKVGRPRKPSRKDLEAEIARLVAIVHASRERSGRGENQANELAVRETKTVRVRKAP